MADMPSHRYPPRRPSPPSPRSRSRSDPFRDPRRNGPDHLNGTRRGEQYLRPPEDGEAWRTNGTRGVNGDFSPEQSDAEEDEHDYEQRGRTDARDGHGQPNGDGQMDAEDGDSEEEEPDYYAILNVPPDASPTQIRSAYHTLSRRFHPDKQPPAQRDLATAHFNRILVAYETLNNPHKRIVYDQLGHAGLREKTWQLGTKSMSPEEFKRWLQGQIKKQRQEEIEQLVGSKGALSLGLDVRGMRYDRVAQDGSRVSLPKIVITNFGLKYSFHAPLTALGQLLRTPLPQSLRDAVAGKWPKPAAASEKAEGSEDEPMFTLAASAGGDPAHTRDDDSLGIAIFTPSGELFERPAILLGAPSLDASLTHVFPSLPPDSPRSVSSLLSGHEVRLTTALFPRPFFTSSASRAFGQNVLTTQTTFNKSPLSKPPALTLQFVRRLGLRHQVLAVVNNHSNSYPSSLLELLFPPPRGARIGMASVGYTYTPLPQGLEDLPSTVSRSQGTETYSVVLSAGTLAGGGLIKFTWGRTFFLGTPLGAQRDRPPTDPSSKKKPPTGVGIRLQTSYAHSLTGDAAYSVSASREMFAHTVLGLKLSVGGASGSDGVALSLIWRRLGQKITLPVLLAPMADSQVIIAAAALPLVAYAATELLWLRPRERRIKREELERKRMRLKRRLAKRKRAALEAAELMRAAVERRMEAERRAGGLVVVKAEYGVGRRWADVTVPLAAMVEGSQLVLPRGVDKTRLMGFWDPAPGEKKVLRVRYLYDGLVHEVAVPDGQGLVAPMRSHRVPVQ